MTNKETKFNRAIVLIGNNQDLKALFPKLSQMKRETVYARLTQCGYVWDVPRQRWQLALPARQNDARAVSFTDSVRKNFILVRVMARADIAEAVGRDIAELLDLANIEVLSVSRPVNNRDGEFARVYLRGEKRG